MTQPMARDCIKKHSPPSWLKFNLLLKTVDLVDEIGHVFVVNMEFDKKRAICTRDFNSDN